MAGEGDHVDLKSDIDLDDAGAMMELVKDLIAIANSGGGLIRIGMTELAADGIDGEKLTKLDGAKISDQVNRYVSPKKVHVEHNVADIGGGRVLIDLTISSSGKYPLVVSRLANYQRNGRQISVMRPGEIYVRHGAKSELASYEDIVAMIDNAVNQRREEFLQNIQRLAWLPEGSQVAFSNPSGALLQSPEYLIDFRTSQRSYHRGALLDGNELLWCFVQRNLFILNEVRLAMLVRSALRRTPTLFFWLAEAISKDTVEEVISTSLQDDDRDKSDANQAILEVGSLLASDACLEEASNSMATSKYQHFRGAASNWAGREESLIDFDDRVAMVRVRHDSALETDIETLYGEAEAVARAALEGGKLAPNKSRRLGDLGRVVFKLRRGNPRR